MRAALTMSLAACVIAASACEKNNVDDEAPTEPSTLRTAETEEPVQAEGVSTPQDDRAELPAGQHASIEVEEHPALGAYITDSAGMALYMFMADTKGGPSTCYDACAEAWPPLTTQGPVEAAQSVDASLVGTIQRRTGETQVTFNGWPLYRYVKDQGRGQVTGQDVEGFGAEWYVMSPQGEIIRKEAGEVSQR